VCSALFFVPPDEVKTVNRDNEQLRELKETQARLKELYLASHRRWTWHATGASCGLAGGILAATLGTLLSASAWALGDETGVLSMHGVGSILLLSTIPLLITGAHCLDLLERRMEMSVRVNSGGAPQAARLTGRARSRIATVLAFFLLLCGMPLKAQAQQTVHNVPITDVLPPGKAYVELDISAKPVDPKFSSFVPRVVVGAGGRVEVGLNVTGNIQPGRDATTVVPAAKWKVYDGRDNGWAIAVGNNLFIPVRNKSYNLGTYAYTMIQKRLSPKTRVGFGGYFYSRNVVAPDANRAGGQFTFEQTVTRRLNINADWFTGRHANGYFTPGIAYKLTNKLTGVAAYSIGNDNARSGNHFLYFELGCNIN
jgi:hypothetical protein